MPVTIPAHCIVMAFASDIEFAMPWAFLLLLVPLFVYLLVPPARPAGGALRVPFYSDITEQPQGRGVRRNGLLPAYMGLIWCLLVVACARPQFLDQPAGTPVSGRDLMMAVDVSGSMKTRDMFTGSEAENRLSAVKRVAGEFIQHRQGDRIGLILFGSRAYLQAPLSLDRVTVNQLLQEAAIGMAGEKTAIGDAIGLAMKRLESRPGSERLLILLTDGENTAGTMEPIKAAELAKLGGMRIHTIGVGAQPGRSSGIFGGTLFGQRSDLDEKSLEEIARLTGGQYFRATDSASLSRIYSLIDRLEPVDELEQHLRPKIEMYPIPLAMALLLSILLALVRLLPATWPWRTGAGHTIKQGRGLSS